MLDDCDMKITLVYSKNKHFHWESFDQFSLKLIDVKNSFVITIFLFLK